jgi:hypothetical protein
MQEIVKRRLLEHLYPFPPVEESIFMGDARVLSVTFGDGAKKVHLVLDAEPSEGYENSFQPDQPLSVYNLGKLSLVFERNISFEELTGMEIPSDEAGVIDQLTSSLEQLTWGTVSGLFVGKKLAPESDIWSFEEENLLPDGTREDLYFFYPGFAFGIQRPVPHKAKYQVEAYPHDLAVFRVVNDPPSHWQRVEIL